MANPPIPIEKRRKLGNPQHRPLPTFEETGTILPAVEGIRAPTPLRPLRKPGRSWWDMVLTAGSTWIAGTDIELVQQVAEQIDEQAALRKRVMMNRPRREGWRDRSHLRQLDEQIRKGLNDLGFTPVARTRMGLAQVTAAAIVQRGERGPERVAGKMFSEDGISELPPELQPGPAAVEPEGMPFKSWTKARIVEWYQAHAIEIPEGATRADLLQLVGVKP